MWAISPRWIMQFCVYIASSRSLPIDDRLNVSVYAIKLESKAGRNGSMTLMQNKYSAADENKTEKNVRQNTTDLQNENNLFLCRREKWWKRGTSIMRIHRNDLRIWWITLHMDRWNDVNSVMNCRFFFRACSSTCDSSASITFQLFTQQA